MRNMFVKALSLGAMALLTAGWGSAAQAQNITGSSHDLRLEITAGSVEICVFCHTPHNTTAPEAPLWNRQAPAQATWTMYSSATIDMTIAAAPQGVSAGCLSCHDGITAYDSLINQPRAGAITAPGTMGAANPLAVGTGGDLANDHPISVTYDTGADPDFNTPVNGKLGELPLYNAPGVDPPVFNQVECGSCHNPHDQDVGGPKEPFLRIANTNSAICFSCHAK